MESGKAFAICGIPKPDEAMNNIVNPRNASSETRRSGRVAEPEGVLIRRESAEGDTLASGHVDKGMLAVSGWRLAVGEMQEARGGRKPDRMPGAC